MADTKLSRTVGPTMLVSRQTTMRRSERRCDARSEAILAAGCAMPAGWVSPGYAGSAARLKTLSKAGVFYSCDDAADDLPYVVTVRGQPFAMLPRTSFGTNDLDNWFAPRHSASTFLDQCRSQFDGIYHEAKHGRPGWMELVLHAHMAGRLQAMLAIREIFDYVLRQEGVCVATRRELARWVIDHPEFHG